MMSFILSILTYLALASPGEALRALPVQDAGRIKPFDSFARESLEQVYGKTSYRGEEAWRVVFTWLLAPELWQEAEIFEVRNAAIKESLGLSKEKKHFKAAEIFGSNRFAQLMQELQLKRESKEKLTPYFQALQRLENQFFVFRAIGDGTLVRPLPTPDSDVWRSVAEMSEAEAQAFQKIATSFSALQAARVSAASSTEVESKARELDQAVSEFMELASRVNPEQYGILGKVKSEVFYNKVHPFRISYVFYLLGAVCVLLLWITAREGWMKWAWILTALGFVFHCLGFALRVYIAGRPPVANMYETVVWVAWGAVVFAVILELIYKTKFYLLSGALVAWFSLVIADSAPAVLDPTLQPLEAVLNSSYWLIVHVMTITISYSAFFLAFVLGDIGLVYYLRDEKRFVDKIKVLVQGIYRSIQIGVAFLAPGIILGGIWADYSWGRFWGWDPKETWALIALLGYLAVLHGRLTSWIKDFGMVVSGVLTFSLVIMAWYGVNFVLGAGLHSYGFGAGGVEYVSGFVILHFLFVLYVWLVRVQRQKESRP